jgi:hypothetical protein
MALHVHCFVSGANLLHGLAAGFRYYVFSKELPLVSNYISIFCTTITVVVVVVAIRKVKSTMIS